MSAHETRLPSRHLTAVIRDDSPVVHAQASPRYRTVRIALTEYQRRQLGLRWTGRLGATDLFEEIDRLFVEPEEE